LQVREEFADIRVLTAFVGEIIHPNDFSRRPPGV
jgi:hypothetical protein